ncbi:formylglycine-generating enzyme family protein [Vagococcus fluvialis]|uniref:formylglycine-generating enzyme family protein n=1 Tax=Vagococcus fluvialis TaxID=2738 RepID=UPI003B59F707
MILIPSTQKWIGTESDIGFDTDKEGPKVLVDLPAFEIDETTVTNEEFGEFVQKTGYLTEAEKFGWSFVFGYFLSDEAKEKSQKVNDLSWWYAVPGACWKHPEGKGSNVSTRLDHPVVHVSRNDAVAYCQWAGKRLPTEAEWEIAAKGLGNEELYPWGKERLVNNQHHCNIWQGDFPTTNTMLDDYANTAPVKTYEPNDYGIYQMIGNVWEWCVNPRGIDLAVFQDISGQKFWQRYQLVDDNNYAIKGGSFLCHDSYCKRYRIAARNGNTAQSTSNNTGFRCVRDVK